MKRLLIISRYFAPGTSVGGHRALKLTRRIGDFGWEPHVLTTPPRCQFPVDPDFGRDVLDRVPVITTPCWSLGHHTLWYHRETQPLKRLALRAGRAVDCWARQWMPVDTFYPWAVRAARRGAAWVREQNICLIWATSPHTSTLLLARWISLRTGVPYVADFRDVSLLPGRGATRQQRSNAEADRDVLGGAAGVTYVSPAQEQVLASKCERWTDMPHCLAYNWFEAETARSIVPATMDCPTIVHGGNLYGGHRRIDAVLEAIARLNREPAMKERPLRLQQYGMENVAKLEAIADQVGARAHFQAHGNLSHREFLATCKGADVLLVSVGRDSGLQQHAGAIPGKVFDYLSCHRPILVTGPPGCEAGKLVTRLGRGIAVADDDPAGIAHAISKLLDRQGEDGALRLEEEAVAEVESRSVVANMAAFFDGLLETKTP